MTPPAASDGMDPLLAGRLLIGGIVQLSALNLPEARPGVNNNYQQLVKLSNIDKMIKIMIKPWSRAGQPGRGRHALTWTAQTCRVEENGVMPPHSAFSLCLVPSTNPIPSASPRPQEYNRHTPRHPPPSILHPLSMPPERLVTALSRLENEKRRVFIDLSRCHGSRGVNTPPCRAVA